MNIKATIVNTTAAIVPKYIEKKEKNHDFIYFFQRPVFIISTLVFPNKRTF